MPAVEGRLLSVAWHPDAHTLVTGSSAGMLHAWDVASARELLRINAGMLLISKRARWLLQV